MSVDRTSPELKQRVFLFAYEFLEQNLDNEVGAMVLDEDEIDDDTLSELQALVSEFRQDVTEARQKVFYLENNGNLCPFCHTDDICSMGGLNMDGGVAWQNVHCDRCEEEWNDVYKLIDVDLRR